MREEFACDVAADPPPDLNKVLASLAADKHHDFQFTLLTLINLFETVAIAVRHGIIDEDIAYDYLGKIMPAYYFFAQPMIEERRKAIRFERGSGSLEYCANRWRVR